MLTLFWNKVSRTNFSVGFHFFIMHYFQENHKKSINLKKLFDLQLNSIYGIQALYLYFSLFCTFVLSDPFYYNTLGYKFLNKIVKSVFKWWCSSPLFTQEQDIFFHVTNILCFGEKSVPIKKNILELWLKIVHSKSLSCAFGFNMSSILKCCIIYILKQRGIFLKDVSRRYAILFFYNSLINFCNLSLAGRISYILQCYIIYK